LATVTKGQTFSATETITNTKLHNLVDLATVSGIVNADIDSSAAIADTKLASITTAGTVMGTAISGLTGVPGGAGKIPVANIDTGTTANKILILDSSAKIPAVDGSLITSLNASELDSGTVPVARIDTGTTANKIVQLDSSAKLPAVDGSQLTGISSIPNYIAGDNIEISSDTIRNSTNTTYTKVKEIRIARAGTLRVKFNQSTQAVETTAYARVYRNGVAVGTEYTTNLTGGGVDRSEDISGWSSGDLCQIYLKTTNAIHNSYCKNFRVCCSVPSTSQLITD